jgi:hypothetical protein
MWTGKLHESEIRDTCTEFKADDLNERDQSEGVCAL